MSQLALSQQADVSTRHISFVENGRSAPSREMVLVLASALDLPLRERNALLEAAGFAAVYPETPLESDALADARRAVEFLLERHEPYPALAMDRHWNVVTANGAALALFTPLLQQGRDGPAGLNAVEMIFDPDGLRGVICNWEELAGDLIQRLHHESAFDTAAAELLERVLAFPDVPHGFGRPDPRAPHSPLLAVHLKNESLDLRLFTALTTLGTPQDVTLQELRIETYFPADAAAEAFFAGG